MKITIQGQDYSNALDWARPLTIERKLNAPSTCEFWLTLPKSGVLAAPERLQAVSVAGDDGSVYFTGYIAASPLPQFAGVGVEGPVYCTVIQAVSEEVLFDRSLMPSSAGVTSETASTLMASLVHQAGAVSVSVQGTSMALANNFGARNGSNWSERAAQIAGMTRTAYRVLQGELTLADIPAVVHTLSEADGSFTPANLSLTGSTKRVLANDVTVCGENEPTAYITEYFLGDGSTAQFNLAEDPWMVPSGSGKMIRERFDEPQIDQSVWSVGGGAGYLSLGSNGLAMNGGSGLDGETILNWSDRIEMGGTLLLEAVGVTIAAGSSGILAAFYVQPEMADSCTAGFQATAQPGSGAVTLQPFINGSAAGVPFSINPANQYTLRVRVHCPECERTRSVYRAFGDQGEIVAGGDSMLGPGRIQMEIQQFVNGVAAMPVTLYDGGVANLPGFCYAIPVSSIDLTGSMRAFYVSNLGSGWVVSTIPGDGPVTRRIGTTAEGAECQVDRTGKVTFFPGAIPAVGEQVAVSYRGVGRAVGRSAGTDQQGPQGGGSAGSSWVGTVSRPPARSSADCRNSARVLRQAAICDTAGWSGTYKAAGNSFAADVWPGDAFQLNAHSAGLNAQVVIREVKLSYRASVPDLLDYEIRFANDWAEDLAISTSTTVPENAWLPAEVDPIFLTNLQGMKVLAVDGSTVTIDTGVAPPQGGGFEVRLRDYAFMPGSDPTLVTRTSAQQITFSRASFADRFFVRSYDGAQPPNYSEFSAAVFVNLPLSH